MIDKPSGVTESAEDNPERIEVPMGGLDQGLDQGLDHSSEIQQPLTMNALDPAVAQSEPVPRGYQLDAHEHIKAQEEDYGNSQDYEDYGSS